MRKLLPALLLLAITLAAQAPAEPEAEALREQARALLRQAAAVAVEAEPRDRTKLLSDIASLQWKLGDRDAANKNFDLAQEVLETVQDPSDAEPPALYPGAVATARIQVGDVDGAARTLERIQDPKTRKQVIESLAWGRARNASTPEEVEAARALVDQESADRIARMLVGQRAKQGDSEGARALAETIVNPKDRAPALLILATTPAEIGAARSLVDSRAADDHCAMSAYRRAEAGEFELARTFAEAVADPAKKAQVFKDVASIEKRIRDKEAGKPPAVDESGFFYGRGKPTCWLEVPATPELEAQVEAVIQRALAGDLKGALEIVSQIPSKEMQENLLVSLSVFQAYKEGVKNARATAERLRRNDCRAFALEYIFLFQIQAGDLTGAASTIDSMPDSLKKGSALTRLAAAQIKAGESEGVLALLSRARGYILQGEVNEIFSPAPRQRAQALGRVAIFQARLGERELAAKTFAEAADFAIAGGEEEGTWTTLEIVAQMHAQAGLIAEGIAFVQAAPVKNRLSQIRHLMSITGRQQQVAESLAAAENLTIPAQKASALLGVAEGLNLYAAGGPYKWPE